MLHLATNHVCNRHCGLQRNYFANRELQDIGYGLIRNTSLRELYLRGNAVRLEGADSFGRALLANSSLRVLDLSVWHHCCCHWLYMCNDALSLSLSLSLYTKSNYLGDTGVQRLCAGLALNVGLQSLNLSV
jgi:hypothetical protein